MPLETRSVGACWSWSYRWLWAAWCGCWDQTLVLWKSSQCSSLPSHLSTPPSHIFESESLNEPGAYCFSYTDCPRSPGICLSPKRWSYSACRQTWLSGNLNLGPHTSKASALPPESSPQPTEISWRDNLYIEIYSVNSGSLKWKYFLCICLYDDRKYLTRTSSLKRSAVVFCLWF